MHHARERSVEYEPFADLLKNGSMGWNLVHVTCKVCKVKESVFVFLTIAQPHNLPWSINWVAGIHEDLVAKSNVHVNL